MTLVEVMIAMLLGVFLMGGVLQVFASSRQTYRVHEATSRMQENGRMALEVLSRDIRMADFWGCVSDPSNFVNNLDTAGAGYVDFLSGGIGGTEGAAGAPDSLILRGGIDSGITVEPPYGPQASANIKVPASNGLEQDDIVFVADCSAGDIFQITNANPDSSGRRRSPEFRRARQSYRCRRRRIPCAWRWPRKYYRDQQSYLPVE